MDEVSIVWFMLVGATLKFVASRRCLGNGLFDVSHIVNRLLGTARSVRRSSGVGMVEPEWSAQLRSNWRGILSEFESYRQDHVVPAHAAVNPQLGGARSGQPPDRKGSHHHLKWKTVYLKAFGVFTDAAAECFPLTRELVSRPSILTAYFSVMEPGASLPEHVGLFKGVLRYHLGLKVPAERPKNCFIAIKPVSRTDGSFQKYSWKPGEPFVFDDTLPHFVRNDTQFERIILFLDFSRQFDPETELNHNMLSNLFLQMVANSADLKTHLSNANSFHVRKHDH